MYTYVITKGTNFKTFLKESYAIALDSCYIFPENSVEHGIENNVDSVMEFTYIKYS